MSAPILATKLYVPPPRPQVVLRSRLIGRLNEGLYQNQGLDLKPGFGRKLTLISASAGFGKTTLLSEWINAKAEWLRPLYEGRNQNGGRPRDEYAAAATYSSLIPHPLRVAWLSLDAGDSDPIRFLTYLVAALQTIRVKAGEGVLAALESPQPPPTEYLLTILLNEIATVPEHFILVLDDYHLIDAKPVDASMSVDAALAFLLEHLPPQMHLVIATREDPHLPLARLRVRGELTELRAADLRFTPAEAADFLNRAMGLNLSAEDIAALETRTEGWIAGLQLAALSMRGHQDTAGFIKSFTGSHHFVLDYLITEVLQRQSESVQHFLLRTSILNRLCGSLCDAILLDSSGQATLEYLERANLFIVPLDQERRWYRYHHLFGDLLRQRLGQPQELSNLHLRASAWYEANDDLAEAFHHAFAAGDCERAARLAEVAWPDMERSFQTAAWLGWVKKLPNVVVCSRPRLCVQLGWAFSDAGELESSETYLQNAERALAGAIDQEEDQSLPGNIALIRASNAQNLGNLAETVKYAEQSIQLIPEDDLYLRASAAITLGFTHWATGHLEASLRAILAWMEDMQKLGNQVFVIASAFAVADMQVTLGHLGEAEKALRRAIQQAAALGREAESVTTHHHLGLAMLAYERGDDVAMRQHLQTAADLGQRTTLVDWPHRWNLAQARIKESAGEWDAALELFDQARRVYVKNPVPILQPVEAHKVRVYLKQGRLDKAQAWVRERNISAEGEVRYLDEYDHLTLVRVRLSEDSFTGVNDLLERLLALAETQKRTGSVIEILLTQALVHQAQNNRPQALAAMEHALALAEPEGYLRIFVDEGEPMRLLILDFAQSSGLGGLWIEKQSHAPVHPQRGYVDKLLAAFAQPEVMPQSKILVPALRSGASAGVSNQQAEIVEPLSQRELEVLRLIAQGLSNREIGERLFLALSTVKGHSRIIFDKLQVHNRTEAVARGRELGLL